MHLWHRLPLHRDRSQRVNPEIQWLKHLQQPSSVSKSSHILKEISKVQLYKLSGYFQISFSDTQISGITNYPSINVRTLQGTPLKIDLFVKGRLNTNDYISFYKKYGDDWMFYLRQKISNQIIRQTSTKGFYDLTSEVIRQQSGKRLRQFDEFLVDIVSIGIQLPKEYLSSVNGTIGWNVFQRQAELVLLTQSYQMLNAYIADNSGDLAQEFKTHGVLQATKDQIILNNSIVNSTSTTSSWNQGMAVFDTSITPEIKKQILWYYFQSYHNSSFNPYSHPIQFN